jgi:hypothetical protein
MKDGADEVGKGSMRLGLQMETGMGRGSRCVWYVFCVLFLYYCINLCVNYMYRFEIHNLILKYVTGRAATIKMGPNDMSSVNGRYVSVFLIFSSFFLILTESLIGIVTGHPGPPMPIPTVRVRVFRSMGCWFMTIKSCDFDIIYR